MSLLEDVDDGIESPHGKGLLSHAPTNPEMFARILKLYARPGMRIADVTYGRGVFWKHINRSLYDLALTDIMTGVDFRHLPYEDESLDMVVLDPPYRFTAATTRLWEGMDQPYQIMNTLGAEGAKRVRDVVDLYREGMTEAARTLRRGGFLVVKAQDTFGEGRQHWIHVELMKHGENIGCECVDLAVVYTDAAPPTRWPRQRTLKKSHSYFLICRKGGAHPFGYRSLQTRTGATAESEDDDLVAEPAGQADVFDMFGG